MQEKFDVIGLAEFWCDGIFKLRQAWCDRLRYDGIVRVLMELGLV